MCDNIQYYCELFFDDIFLMDVCVLVEYYKGVFFNIVNWLLMNDIEWQKVGISYKQYGQQVVIVFGYELVCGVFKVEWLVVWKVFVEVNLNGYLYCFCGGLCLQIVQQWLKQDVGIDYLWVIGGYKVLCNFFFEIICVVVDECDFVLVGGFIGCGKIEVIVVLDNSFDFEGYVNYCGFSFGW